MFTGLVEEIGRLVAVESMGASRRFTIRAEKILADAKIDDSICINGVCLTIVAISGSMFQVQAVDETLRKTTLGNLRQGSRVNLERALRPADRLGGHFVQGHVDGTAKIVDLIPQAAGKLMVVELDDKLLRYIIPHGSIALDGVSLTVARLENSRLTIALIPHTLAQTTLGERQAGDWLNVETDLLGKYVERLLATRVGSGVTEAQLMTWGYGDYNKS
ncbi:riboflavin synthase [candidate division KSB1 bacterium]|nr:riboflavin synthase [candidate division KSB1 bacterium]